MGMADDIQLMQMLRNYQLPPPEQQQPAGYQPMPQMPPMPMGPQPQRQPMFPGFSVETNLEGRGPQDLARQLRYHPYWLQYNRQF